MKREFKIKCKDENYILVKSIISNYRQISPIGFVLKSEDRTIRVNKDNYEYNEIWFKCSKNKLNECREVLRQMLNTGLLSSAVEIW